MCDLCESQVLAHVLTGNAAGVRCDALFHGSLLHGNRRGAGNFHHVVGSSQNGRVGISLDDAALEDDLLKIAGDQHRFVFTALSAGNSDILEMAGDLFVFVTPEHAGSDKVANAAIL